MLSAAIKKIRRQLETFLLRFVEDIHRLIVDTQIVPHMQSERVVVL